MIVQINNKFKIIDKNATAIAKPVVTSVQKVTNKDRVTKTNINVNFKCGIHKKNYTDAECEKIEVFLSPISLDATKQELNRSMIEIVRQRINEQIVNVDFAHKLVHSLETNSVMNSAMIKYTSTLKREIIAGFNKKNNIKKITSLSANSEQLELGFKNVLRLVNVPGNNPNGQSLNREINLLVQKTLQDSGITSSRANFKKNYNFLKKQGIDSLFLFENNFNKSSNLLHRQGTKVKTPLRLNGFDKYLKHVYATLSNEIVLLSNTGNFGKYENARIPDKVALLDGNFFISLEDMELLGSEAYLFFYAKDKQGLNLCAENVYFNTQEIKNQITKSSTTYNVGAGRNKNTNVSKLIIGNNNQVDPLNVTVYAKELLNYPNPQKLDNFSKIQQNLIVEPGSSIKLNDGKIGNVSFASRFKDSRNILYRTTLNFKNINFDNAKTNFSKSSRLKFENTPSCVMTARCYTNYIEVAANTIADNVVGYRFVKFKYMGSVRGKKSFVVDESGNEINIFIARDPAVDGQISINDFDVFDGKVYEYKLECQTESGEVVIANSNACLEMYEKPQQLVEIRTSKITRTNTGGSFYENFERGDEINFTLGLIQNQPQFEILIKRIAKTQEVFNISMFKELLNKLSSLADLSYSVLVERIDKQTGEKALIDTIIFDQNSVGNSNLLVKDVVRFGSDVCYKLTPRIKPTDSLIRSVQNILEDLSRESRFNVINYASAQMQNTRRSLSEGIVSIVNDKFNSSLALKRGLIIPESIRNAKSSVDMFFDASTGDTAYIESYAQKAPYNSSNLVLDNSVISEIKSISRDNNRLIRQNNFKNKIKLRDQKFELKFEVNGSDITIDYYIIFVKNEAQIYIDGAAHSRDENFKATVNGTSKLQYKYLVEHYATEGAVEYYAVPVSKKGDLLTPFFLTSHIIQ